MTQAEHLIENVQWQQKLHIAERLAAEVLKEAGDMGLTGEGDLSNAVQILNNCIHHFSMEQGDLEESLEG